MFKHCIIHYPADKADLKAVYKEIISLRAAGAVQYVRSRNLNDRQIEALFDSLLENVPHRNR